jgi:uncharacterized protein (TIGR00299 family) protein
MVLGALVDAGLDLDVVADAVSQMGVTGVTLASEDAQRGGLIGTYVRVELDADAERARNFDEFIAMVESSTLSDRVKEQSNAVFRRMAEAEARVHRTSVHDVHLHELGTLDTLADVVGAVVGLEALDVDKVFSSPFPMGVGVFRSAHGVLPVPSPATSALLTMSDAPLVPAPGNPAWTGEMVTPTGAGIITTLAEFRQPKLNVQKIGYGLGARNPDEYPNALGLWLGELDEEASTDGLSLIETNLDDCTGEVMGYVQERLFTLGARDVWFTPIQMKKNRPATMLSVIVSDEYEREAVETILRETTTLGVRVRPITRHEAGREIKSLETSLGTALVKVKIIGGEAVSVSPEYEDCRRLAIETGLPLQQISKTVQREAEHLILKPQNPS